MKKSGLIYILALLTAFSFPVFAQEESYADYDGTVEVVKDNSEFNEESIKCSAADILKPKYGNVIVSDEGNSTIKLTLTVPNEEIEKMLSLVVSDGWFPKSLTIQSANGSLVVFMSISREKNDSFRRFKVLQKLSAKGILPWKGSVLDNKEAYVTSIETQFGEDFLIKGQTLKSNLIFTKLTPRISSIGADKENLDSERFSSRSNFDRTKIFTRESYSDNDTGINGQPFFERGTYKEDPSVGRYMVFTLRCRW